MRHRHPISLVGATLAACLLALGCADNTMTAPRTLSPAQPSADRQLPTFEISTIDVDGALLTQPQGINASGDVVGWYIDANKRSHGFIRHGGVITTVDYLKPDNTVADNTTLRGIGPDGQTVGTYRDNSEEAVASHGFRRTADGQLIPVQYIGSDNQPFNVVLQRILSDGTILGCRHIHDTMGSMKGIVIVGDQTTEIDAYSSMNNGATPDGRLMTGFYTNMMMNRTEAYIIENGAFSSFVVPGSASTSAWDVNPRGDIVGVFMDAHGAHGFVRTDGGYTTIDVNGASGTRAFGINARGDVVGTYAVGAGTAAVTHGFLATRVR